MGIGLDFNFDQLQRQLMQQLTDLERQVVPRATRAALERVGVTLRKEAAIAIRQELNISAARAKDAIDVRTNDTTIRFRVNPKPIGLRDYGAKQTKPGVSYQIGPKTGRKVYRNKYGGSFIVEKIGGHVFVRTSVDPPGPKKARITKLSGPSAANAFRQQAVQDRLNAVAQERFAIEFPRAVAAIAGGASS